MTHTQPATFAHPSHRPFPSCVCTGNSAPSLCKTRGGGNNRQQRTAGSAVCTCTHSQPGARGKMAHSPRQLPTSLSVRDAGQPSSRGPGAWRAEKRTGRKERVSMESVTHTYHCRCRHRSERGSGQVPCLGTGVMQIVTSSCGGLGRLSQFPHLPSRGNDTVTPTS